MLPQRGMLPQRRRTRLPLSHGLRLMLVTVPPCPESGAQPQTRKPLWPYVRVHAHVMCMTSIRSAERSLLAVCKPLCYLASESTWLVQSVSDGAGLCRSSSFVCSRAGDSICACG